MKKCASCGNMVNEQLNFCPDCGQEVPMFGDADLPPPPPPVPTANIPLPPAAGDEFAPDRITMGEYAGFWIRFVAYAVDMFVSGLVQAPFLVLGGFSVQAATASSAPQVPMLGFMLVSVAQFIFWCVNSVYLQSTYGWTLGKRLCGLVVLRADGDYMTIGDAIVRGLFKAWISRTICGLGCIMAAFDADKQSWHDKVANTFVYYD